MKSDKQGYDRAVTLYAPDGSLYQVEYARKAVGRGNTSLGVTHPDGFVLVSDSGRLTRLKERRGTKISAIDEHIGCASAGLVGDARQLIDILRQEAQKDRVIYDKKLGAKEATKRVTRQMQEFTQNGGVRPFGVSLLIGSAADGDLYLTSPSGAFLGMDATAIGRGREEARGILEERRDEAQDTETALELALDVMDQTLDHPLSERAIEIGIGEDGSFRVLTDDEVDEHVEAAG